MSAKVQSIQALRSLASPVVAMSHLLNVAYALGGASVHSFQQIMIVPADAAVSCFFAVSGFIMAMIADKGRSASEFVARRVIRIFPAYWIALAVAMVIPPIIPGMVPATSLQEVLLLQPAMPLPLTWALAFEIYFYACVTLIMVCCRSTIANGFALFACIHVALILAAMGGAVTPHLVLVPAAASFWIGVVVYFVTKSHIEWRPVLAICAAISLLIVSTTFGPRGNNMLLYTTLFAPIFFAVIKLERRGTLKVPSGLVWWSNRSYALFLWHLPVMAGAAWVTRTYSSFATTGGLTLFFTVSIFGSIAAALIGYRFVERPLTTGLNKAWDSRAVSPAKA